MDSQLLVRRLLTAKDVLLGRLDHVFDLAQALQQAEQREQAMRKVAENISKERDYWRSLWMAQGKEFENSLSAMLEEIQQLRKKAGITGNKWEELVKKAFHDRHVQPAKHPVSGVRCEAESIDEPKPQPNGQASE